MGVNADELRQWLRANKRQELLAEATEILERRRVLLSLAYLNIAVGCLLIPAFIVMAIVNKLWWVTVIDIVGIAMWLYLLVYYIRRVRECREMIRRLNSIISDLQKEI